MKNIETSVKEVVTQELEKFADEIIQSQVTEFQKQLAKKSKEIISKIIESIAVTVTDDVSSGSTIIQFRMTK